MGDDEKEQTDVMSVSASWNGPGRHRGTVSIDNIGGGVWWVSRALVQPEEARRQGVGSRLLLEAIEKAHAAGAAVIHVSPGGYDMERKDQVRFYEKAGFKQREEDLWVLQLREAPEKDEKS